MSKEEEHNEILKKLAEREISDIPNDSPDEVKSMKEILDASDNWKTPENKSKDDVWKSLEDKLDLTDANGVDPRIRKRIAWLRLGIAAVLLVGFSVLFRFFQANETRILSNDGETISHVLPDNSKVILNAKSELKYKPDQFTESREVTIRGEAYFEVEEGDQFIVQSNGVSISVLGTSFNVYSRSKLVEVKCLSGSVEVQARANKIALKKGEMIFAKDRTLSEEKTSFDVEKAISWTEGKFYFDNADLKMVIKELEIQFGVDIEGQDFNDRMYSGYFDNSSLEKALNQVLVPMGYSYSVDENTVTVK